MTATITDDNTTEEFMSDEPKTAADLLAKYQDEHRALLATLPESDPDYREQVRFGDLLQKIEADNDGGCWVWLGKMSNDGWTPLYRYTAQVESARRVVERSARRIVYERLIAPIGRVILRRTCANARCVRPEHATPTTYALGNSGRPRGSKNVNSSAPSQSRSAAAAVVVAAVLAAQEAVAALRRLGVAAELRIADTE